MSQIECGSEPTSLSELSDADRVMIEINGMPEPVKTHPPIYMWDHESQTGSENGGR